MATKPSHVVAQVAAWVEYEGADKLIRAGDLFEADHPLVRKYPDYFAAPRTGFTAEPPVEQATAAPGEKRGA